MEKLALVVVVVVSDEAHSRRRVGGDVRHAVL
jgi:hypothetical protein